jgi:hypothetical protein
MYTRSNHHVAVWELQDIKQLRVVHLQVLRAYGCRVMVFMACPRAPWAGSLTCSSRDPAAQTVQRQPTQQTCAASLVHQVRGWQLSPGHLQQQGQQLAVPVYLLAGCRRHQAGPACSQQLGGCPSCH